MRFKYIIAVDTPFEEAIVHDDEEEREEEEEEEAEIEEPEGKMKKKLHFFKYSNEN